MFANLDQGYENSVIISQSMAVNLLDMPWKGFEIQLKTQPSKEQTFFCQCESKLDINVIGFVLFGPMSMHAVNLL